MGEVIFTRQKDFFVGIDSDGCVFDNMDIKHKECFCPAYIGRMGLQALSNAAREVWEFVNLYSRTRGINRFKALLLSLETLAEHPQTRARNAELPDWSDLSRWLDSEEHPGNGSLERELLGRHSAFLEEVLAWSHEVNRAVEHIVRGVKPFPAAVEALQRLDGLCDAVVVSQAPHETLEREWGEEGLRNLVRLLMGQEQGSKTGQLSQTARHQYEPGHMLMLGDSPGDHRAADESGALFYPVIPGREEESWERFNGEGLDRFLALEFEGDYQQVLLEEFYASLPEAPGWKLEPARERE